MDTRTNSGATPKKKTYNQPSLTKYGQLKDLTTGGSKGGKEKGGELNKKA